MKHTREDYAHIQDSTGKIPADEPVFLLRGQDKLAINALNAYRQAARMHELPESFLNGIDKTIIAITEWQAQRREKLPDSPRPAAPQKPEVTADNVISTVSELLKDLTDGNLLILQHTVRDAINERMIEVTDHENNPS